MYEQFTDRARQVLRLANQEAVRLSHEHIGTEHILLGLIKEGSGVAANVLKSARVDFHKVCDEVEKRVERGSELVPSARFAQTLRAKKAIEYAMEESRKLGHNYVGTEHILLGLLRDDSVMAAKVLTDLGVKLDALRAETLAMLGYPPNEKTLVLGQIRLLGAQLTDDAREVVQSAYEEALRLKHGYLGTEHLLLGLIKEDTGVTCRVLKALDVDVAKLRADILDLAGGDLSTVLQAIGVDVSHFAPELEKSEERMRSLVAAGRVEQTPQLKRVLNAAVEEAKDIGGSTVDALHLFLGLLREAESAATQVLMNHGVKPERARDVVLALLGASG